MSAPTTTDLFGEPRRPPAAERVLQDRLQASAELDALFRRAFDIKDSAQICALMQWMATVKDYSLFNLWLAKLQRPGCGAIATAKRWAELGRTVNGTAIPIIILRPMGPVMVVYEVGDTSDPSGKLLPESAFTTTGTVTNADLNRLVRRAEADRIEVRRAQLGIWLGGDARGTQRETSSSAFLVRLNTAHPVETQFRVLCHELAHIYCGHLGNQSEHDWWPDRRNTIGKSEREFEAEGAAYLVLTRAGAGSNSAAYLAGYANRCDIAKVSFDTIIRAASRIEHYWQPKQKQP